MRANIEVKNSHQQTRSENRLCGKFKKFYFHVSVQLFSNRPVVLSRDAHVTHMHSAVCAIAVLVTVSKRQSPLSTNYRRSEPTETTFLVLNMKQIYLRSSAELNKQDEDK